MGLTTPSKCVLCCDAKDDQSQTKLYHSDWYFSDRDIKILKQGNSLLRQVAVISDIHGNVWALEAVLNDIRRRGIDAIINLGDTLYGPLEPEATAQIMMSLSLFTIQGNQDRILTENLFSTESPTLAYVKKALAPQSCEWLAAQPATCVVDDKLFLCHGTPQSDETYLLENVENSYSVLHEESTIQAQISSINQKVVLCGHSHIPRTVHLSDGRLIVNPGSVGLPAYTDETPTPHKMENGDSHAQYAVLSKTESGWTVEQIAVPYDWKKAVASARKNGRNDWAAWLATGRAQF